MRSPNDPSSMRAVEAAYQQYAAGLYRYIYRKVGQSALAEDLTSTVFLKALRWLRGERGTQSMRGWLYATARTTIADYWQVQGLWESVSLDQVEEMSAPVGSAAQRSEEEAARARVRRLLRLLPERDQNVLTLRYLHGYSTEEIGRALGLRPAQVRLVQFRAVRRAAALAAAERSDEMADTDKTGHDEERATSEAIQRMQTFAEEEARALNHNYIGTEHQLLGLLRAEGSRAAQILAQFHVTLERARGGVVMIVGRGEQPIEHELGLTPRAKTVVTLAAREAQRRNSPLVEPEHLLLALLVEGSGIAAGILEALNVRLAQVQALLAPTAEPLVDWTCSFCGKGRHSVERLIQGPGWIALTPSGRPTQPLLICNECVALCAAIIAQEPPARAKPLPPNAEEAAIQTLGLPAGNAGRAGADPVASE